MKLLVLLLVAACSVGLSKSSAADPNLPADFTINTNVIVTSPPRFGVNLRDPAQYNNFILDAGFEPTTTRHRG
jgi:hypothetical protein